MSNDEISLRRFTWLLEQRGYAHTSEDNLEAVITVRTKRPDFVVDTGRGLRFIVEVESFEKETVLRTASPGNRVFSLDPMALQKRINRAVRNAADQLAPYSGDGLPLVVALDNHRRVGLQIARIELMALFGQPRYVTTLEMPSGRAVSGGWEQDSDCPLGWGRRTYVSAVLVNVPEQRFDTLDTTDDYSIPRPMRVDLIHNPEAATPLPGWVFSGPNDRQLLCDGGRWTEFKGAPTDA